MRNHKRHPFGIDICAILSAPSTFQFQGQGSKLLSDLRQQFWIDIAAADDGHIDLCFRQFVGVEKKGSHGYRSTRFRQSLGVLT